MAEPFATVADMRDLVWADMPTEKDADATVGLRSASIEIRALPYRVDARIANGSLALETVQLVACRMVKRSLEEADQDSNVASENHQAGPFGFQRTFVKKDGNIFLSAADKRLLVPPLGKVFSTQPG